MIVLCSSISPGFYCPQSQLLVIQLKRFLCNSSMSQNAMFFVCFRCTCQNNNSFPPVYLYAHYLCLFSAQFFTIVYLKKYICWNLLPACDASCNKGGTNAFWSELLLTLLHTQFDNICI